MILQLDQLERRAAKVRPSRAHRVRHSNSRHVVVQQRAADRRRARDGDEDAEAREERLPKAERVRQFVQRHTKLDAMFSKVKIARYESE